MTYTVEWTLPAQRDMAALPPRYAAAVFVFIDERLASDPKTRSKPLTDGLAAYRGARNGDYRIIFKLDEAHEVISVIRVDHRAHIYRTRGRAR